MIRGLSICLIAFGFLWALVIILLFLAVGAISIPVSLIRTGCYYIGQFVGPVCLVVGPIVVLKGTSSRTGAILAAFGCVILTGIMVNIGISFTHVDPLEGKQPYGLYTFILLLVILVDAFAVQLYRHSK